MSKYKIYNLWPTPVYENNFLIDNDSIDYVRNID